MPANGSCGTSDNLTRTRRSDSPIGVERFPALLCNLIVIPVLQQFVQSPSIAVFKVCLLSPMCQLSIQTLYSMPFSILNLSFALCQSTLPLSGRDNTHVTQSEVPVSIPALLPQLLFLLVRPFTLAFALHTLRLDKVYRLVVPLRIS